ncbi:MAG: SDR family NAD(P)-dependent oxidoreductase [Vicingaceae bacterium]|nr:SDR family NAD(P)-dependent oxidoreductase [Vicingaceae bacterium]
MNYYFITGTSIGLGKSIAELLLKDENNFVYGFSRSESLKHKRYTHTKLDLGNVVELKDFQFPKLDNPEKVVLINNAGVVGSINHVGRLDNQSIIDSYNINLIAPVILSNNFIAKYGSFSYGKIILNISSGAGRTPIDGWSVYCSGKAGMDMFSQVLKDDVGLDNLDVKIMSLAPGIIDTEMQDDIRKSDSSGFSNVERFVEYKKSGDLTDPLIAAQQVIRFLVDEKLQNNVICSVRDL